MARMTDAEQTDQTAMDEVTITDSEAEEALEERHRRKVALAPVKRAYKEAHDAAKYAVERHLGSIPDDGAARIGRFRVTKRIRGHKVKAVVDADGRSSGYAPTH